MSNTRLAAVSIQAVSPASMGALTTISLVLSGPKAPRRLMRSSEVKKRIHFFSIRVPKIVKIVKC
ncbi:MAG: hypothetical protein ACI9YB_001210 [Halioglobus sp.]|jgi:hypothetical protein